MSAATSIEWTDATLSPWIGCTRVSEGCAHCYIERQTPLRVHGIQLGARMPRMRMVGFRKAAFALNRRALREGRQIRVFPSLCDPFDGEVCAEWLADFLEVVRLTPALTWQLLTKRPENFQPRLDAVLKLLVGPMSIEGALLKVWVKNMRDGWGCVTFCTAGRENYWIGATCENQRTADLRIPALRTIPASVRFISVEPMLGAVDLRTWLGGARPDPIHWVICGGESGPEARPTSEGWVRELRDLCVCMGAPFFFKQWGEWLPVGQDDGQINYAKHARHDWPDGTQSYRVGKKSAGHEIDGCVYQAMPEVAHA